MREKLPEHVHPPVRLISSLFFFPRSSLVLPGHFQPPLRHGQRPNDSVVAVVETTHDLRRAPNCPEPRWMPSIRSGNEQSEKTCLYPGAKSVEGFVSDEQLNKVEASICDGSRIRLSRAETLETKLSIRCFVHIFILFSRNLFERLLFSLRFWTFVRSFFFRVIYNELYEHNYYGVLFALTMQFVYTRPVFLAIATIPADTRFNISGFCCCCWMLTTFACTYMQGDGSCTS